MKALQRKRRLAGISQHELAREAGIKFSRLHYAETRRLTLRRDEMERLDRVLRAALVARSKEIAGVLS